MTHQDCMHQVSHGYLMTERLPVWLNSGVAVRYRSQPDEVIILIHYVVREADRLQMTKATPKWLSHIPNVQFFSQAKALAANASGDHCASGDQVH